MALTNAGRSLAVDGVAGTITHIGLANLTGTELSGGTPAYARQAVTWNAAAGSGIRDNNGDLTFDIGGSTGTPVQVGRVLLRGASSGGTDYGWFPTGGQAPMEVTADAATDAFTNYAHGLANGNVVFFEPFAGASLPSGLASGTPYVVANSSTNSFQVTSILGGAVINVTASGECYAQQCVFETFNSQGTYTVAAGDLDLYGLVV